MGTEMEMNSNTNTVHFMDHGIIVDSSLSRFIKEGILISNLEDFSQIKCDSVDLTLGDSCKRIMHNHFEIEDKKEKLIIDTKKIMKYIDVEWKEDSEGNKYIDIAPKEFLLFSTKEKICLPTHLKKYIGSAFGPSGSAINFSFYGRLTGKSSIARLGVSTEFGSLVHSGFEGTITLEVTNHNKDLYVRVYQGMPITQISFFESFPPMMSYADDIDSKYMHQEEATGSRL